MRESWVKPIRTALQVALALAPATPYLVSAIGLNATAGLGALILGVSSAFTRLMSTGMGERLMSYFSLQSR